MAGLRERKKQQARQRIADEALRLFSSRGYDTVTVNEIADAADVSKATLFKYFPSKESLVLQGVADDDLATVIGSRAPGQSITAALKAHFLALSTDSGPDPAETLQRVQIISASPVLRERATSLVYQQRQALADALAAEFGEFTAQVIAAQISAVVLALQERYVAGLMTGAAPDQLEDDVDTALELLEHGLPPDRKKS